MSNLLSPLVIQVGKLKGPFRGFRMINTHFTFDNGKVWLQHEEKYLYFYAHNPRARVVYQQDGSYVLEVDGTDETVQVIPGDK
ncbi:hypothetical protein [Spirosoma foliorum]|uniref:Uncharacterized protein n=1 Tax=Spirosoma foliorum TaxID=2710596 RepID=A0A7G5GUE3_9BACT|nr:hypothetical protein [Spirosoma foliorum]QMW02485.1 hypothetical protein H3H32_32025 [Spirosoma foliorum]